MAVGEVGWEDIGRLEEKKTQGVMWGKGDRLGVSRRVQRQGQALPRQG